MENNEKDTSEASPDAHLDKLAGIGDDGRREQKRIGDLDQAFAEGHIFQERLMWKSAQLFEQCSPNEQGLVAVDDPTSHAAKIVEEGNKSESPIVPGKLVHESTGLDCTIPFHVVEPLNGTVRQYRIGMEKKQPLPARLLGTGIHLGGAAFGRAQHEA